MVHLAERLRKKSGGPAQLGIGMPAADQPVSVTITLSESQDPDRIIRELEQAGLEDSRLMRITGIVIGSISPSAIQRLRQISGVKSVEVSRNVRGVL